LAIIASDMKKQSGKKKLHVPPPQANAVPP